MQSKKLLLLAAGAISLVQAISYASEFCVNETVVYNHQKVVIRALYPDETAAVSYPDSTSTSDVSLSALSEVITERRGFVVGTTVTYNHADVVVRAVYQDDTADISFPDSYTTSNVSISDLSRKISSLGGFTEGQTVTYGHQTVVIRQIFPDGTANISFPDSTTTSNVSVTDLAPTIQCESSDGNTGCSR